MTGHDVARATNEYLRYEAQDILDAAINAGDGQITHLDRGVIVVPVARARALRLIQLGLAAESEAT